LTPFRLPTEQISVDAISFKALGELHPVLIALGGTIERIAKDPRFLPHTIYRRSRSKR
jgi:hypothetical protein